jgi:VWFA-related protein
VKRAVLLAALVQTTVVFGQVVNPVSTELSDGTTDAAAVAVDPPARRPAVTFRGGVDLVALNVVVVDGQQRFVNGLSAANFDIYEDGVQQAVSFFSAEELPLDLAILIDTSASMAEKLATAQQAAIGFASTLRPEDRLLVVDIKDVATILSPLSGDLSAAKAAIRATVARGGTALYNGMYLTMKELAKQRKNQSEVRRQAIVVLSDGADTASLVAFDDVMSLAKQSGMSIYTIMLKSRAMMYASLNRRYFSESEFAMRSLAQETGGRSFFPADISELAGVYQIIEQELANQYAIAYVSKNPRNDGAYRRVVVRLLDHTGAQPRTRAGYVAPRSERASR